MDEMTEPTTERGNETETQSHDAEQTQAAPPPPIYQYGAPPGSANPLKTPGIAAVLSAIPGLGNIYNGLYARGFSFFLIFVSLITLVANTRRESDLAFLIPCMIFFWFFNLFDAYRQATLINAGSLPDLGVSDGARFGRSTLFPGVVLLVIGAYGLMRKYLDVDLSWIFEQWAFIVIAAGAFLIYSAMRGKGENQNIG